VVYLGILACVLTATTIKRSLTFLRKKFHRTEKIMATPMNLPTPGKNPEGAHGINITEQKLAVCLCVYVC